VLVVLAHICEAFGSLPWMGWGLADSVGHYIDLGKCHSSAHAVSDWLRLVGAAKEMTTPDGFKTA
jgi:hypothetical protein